MTADPRRFRLEEKLKAGEVVNTENAVLTKGVQWVEAQVDGDERVVMLGILGRHRASDEEVELLFAMTLPAVAVLVGEVLGLAVRMGVGDQLTAMIAQEAGV